jgi:tetratricopeptide (TPR) repeat protein
MLRRTPLFIMTLLFAANCLAQRGIPDPLQSGQSPQGEAWSSGDSMRNAGSISGSVLSVAGKPLRDVQVQLQDATNGTVVTSGLTNDAGQFEFNSVPHGSYELVAIAGVHQTSGRVEVSSWPATASLRMAFTDKPDNGGGRNTISVVQYRVPEKARKEFDKAEELEAKGKTDQAHKHVDRALEIYPNYADALTLRAILKLSSGNVNPAIADLEHAIHCDANYALAYTVLGSAFNNTRKFDEALRTLKRSDSLAPDSWQTYFEMARAYIGKADYRTAMQHLDRAQSLLPAEFPLIRYVRGFALVALKEYGGAIAELQAFLQKVPNGPESDQARQMLAKVRQRQLGKQAVGTNPF